MKAVLFCLQSLLLLTIASASVYGQHSADNRKRNSIEAKLNEQGDTWNSRFGYSFNALPEFPDEVYRNRIINLESDIALTYNEHVRPFIEHYSIRRREVTERVLDLSRLYFPVFDEMLEEAGLPIWLKYLAVAESTLDPMIESSAEAVGLWQFIAGTGQMYGLKEDYYIDDRRDPIKSTKAAIEHLSDLYDVYEDWYLVFAAYNSGAGNVNKAIRRANGNKDYWAIRKYLPHETRGYVPSFIAACYVLNYHEEHNLYAFTNVDLPKRIDSVKAMGPLSFEKLCTGLEMNLELMQLLNPQFKQSALPDNKQAYHLCVPADMVESFVNNNSGYKIEYIGERRASINEADEGKEEKGSGSSGPSAAPQLMSYVVVSGDNVFKLCKVFLCTEAELRKWNGMSNNILRLGTELQFYVQANNIETVKSNLEAHKKKG